MILFEQTSQKEKPGIQLCENFYAICSHISSVPGRFNADPDWILFPESLYSIPVCSLRITQYHCNDTVDCQ